jgi:hypothetical protein
MLTTNDAATVSASTPNTARRFGIPNALAAARASSTSSGQTK